MDKVQVGNLSISNKLPFALVAGPCQIETLDHALFIAENIKKITDKLKSHLSINHHLIKPTELLHALSVGPD